MSAELTKRIMVRVTDEQLAWIGHMAADEGMDNATFVRVVIDRLSKNRPPLIGMMAVPETPFQMFPPKVTHYHSAQIVEMPQGETSDILAQRVAEAEASLPQTLDNPPEESAAIPLRRVARERYNPGRQ